MKKVFIIACIIFFPSVVYSQQEYFKGYGTGDMTCGKYITKITNDPLTKNSYSWWIDGFVTGTNLEKGRITSTDSEGHKAWVLKYCQENPLEPFIKAMIELNKELNKKIE